jgi:hypothetical protein
MLNVDVMARNKKRSGKKRVKRQQAKKNQSN